MKWEPSRRLLGQRLRNRIMEALEILAAGDDGVRLVWPTEYFHSFYDWLPHRDRGGMRANSAISPEEELLLREVSRVLDDAFDVTPGVMTADELIATGWPRRIQPVARRALALMSKRGRFSEEHEEDEPLA